MLHFRSTRDASNRRRRTTCLKPQCSINGHSIVLRYAVGPSWFVLSRTTRVVGLFIPKSGLNKVTIEKRSGFDVKAIPLAFRKGYLKHLSEIYC